MVPLSLSTLLLSLPLVPGSSDAVSDLPPAPPGLAQALEQEASPRVSGILRRGEAPADSGTVVLHRVTPEEAGAIDSVRVGSDGAFELVLPHTPVRGSGEVFFASHRYEGILYFGSPLAMAEQLDSLYTVQAYETRPAPSGGLPLPVRVRNLFVEEGPMGWRVTDLVEIRNDSALTWVPDPGEDGAVVWRYPLPSEASSFRLGEGDLAPGAVTWEEGEVRVRAPVLPGERLLVFHYEIPSLETRFPLPGHTGILELLVRQPAPPLRVENLQAAGPMEIERGVTYFRWWGEGLQDQEIRMRPGEDGGIPVAWMAVGIAFLLALAGIWLVLGRRRQAGAGVGPGSAGGAAGSGGATGSPPPGGRERGGEGVGSGATAFARRRSLLLAIARLDEEGESAPGGESGEARRERQARREALLRELEEVEAELRGEDASEGRGTVGTAGGRGGEGEGGGGGTRG